MGECADRQVVRLVIVGSGNVATHLAKVFARIDGIKILEVCSPNNSATLAAEIGAVAVSRVDNVTPSADIYVISVSDDSLQDVVACLPRNPDAVYAHTSGSVGMDILKTLSSRTGVFYPLQTFSRNVPVDMSRVPIFVEGVDEETEKCLIGLAQKITPNVYKADSALRGRLHIAAVFACNFVNHLWAVADSLLGRDGLSLEVLYPLLEETLRKAETNHPADVQTGPAARADRNIIEKHASTLPPDLREIYLLLSESIISSRQ